MDLSPPEPVTTRASRNHAIEMDHRGPTEAGGSSRGPDSEIPGNTPTQAVEQTPNVWDPPINKFRLAAVCLSGLLNGFSDAGAGAVIPYMQAYYDIGYAVVSLVFVGQALGFMFAAVFLDSLRTRFGRVNVLAIGNISLIIGYVPVAVATPYPIIPITFFLVGFGAAINMALANIFCGGLQNGTFILGLLHGYYGIGGTVSPLIATALVVAADTPWNRFYLLPLGIGICTLVSSVWVFWDYERELDPGAREREMVKTESVLASLISTLRMRIVLLGAIFIFAYQGAEVSISGWVISFLIDVRDGDPAKVGYVTAGFWAGITAGRFLLSGPAQRWGEKGFVYGFTAVTLGFQLLVWFVPNVVENAIAVAIVGLMLGPIYPCAAAVFIRSMTRRESLRGMVTISAFGSLGGAVAPFFTGLLAQVAGTFVLHPIVIFLLVAMLVCWYGIPMISKREE